MSGMFRKALLSSTILVFSVCVSWGQAPANDNFADATVLSAALPITVPGTTVSATAEAGEPAHAPGFGNVASNSVWYQWQSTLDGLVDITTDGVTYDVVMADYSETALGNLVGVGSADNFFNANEGNLGLV